MSGKQYQYDPITMFSDWIQNNGNAQAQFMRSFADLMNGQSKDEFDPLKTLREMVSNTAKTQARMMTGMASTQSKNMNEIFGFGQIIPNFLNWGAYKTTIGSNGRISIPEAERDALKLEEGDLVQVIILPVAKRSKTKEVKQ